MWRGVALFAANDAETYEVRAMMYGSRRGAVGMTYMRHQRARMGLVCPWQMASMLSHSYAFNLYSSAVRLHQLDEAISYSQDHRKLYKERCHSHPFTIFHPILPNRAPHRQDYCTISIQHNSLSTNAMHIPHAQKPRFAQHQMRQKRDEAKKISCRRPLLPCCSSCRPPLTVISRPRSAPFFAQLRLP